MSMSIDTWKLSRDSVVLAQVLSFIKKIESSKVVTKALDGSVYIQTIGDGTNVADITLFASVTNKDLINVADAEGALVSVVYQDTQYLGYIEETPDWQAAEPGVWYVASIKLLIDEEVSV